MKIFIFEHTRAVGPCVATPGVAAPGVAASVGNGASSSSGFRGDIMLRSLLADITSIDAVDVLTLQDSASRTLRLSSRSSLQSVQSEEIIDAIDHCIDQADAVWPLAPESNGLLEAISERTIQRNKILLGSTGGAVRATTSKYSTALALHANDVPVVPTYRAQMPLPPDSQGWVVKPDDGAGCSDTHIFLHSKAAVEWVAAREHGDYVLQPYITGRPCSLSLLCRDGEVLLMACNDQRVAVSDNQFHYMGSIVNSFDDADGKLKSLALRVLATIPGLWGYVGIDFIVTEQGPVVLEVNPRMTVSHVGLHASLGVNPIQIMLDSINDNKRSIPIRSRNRQISVDIGARQSNRHVVE